MAVEGVGRCRRTITRESCGVLVHRVFHRSFVDVSDLHTAGRGGHNNFQDELFLKFLDHYPPSSFALFILGDFVESWQELFLQPWVGQNWELLRRLMLYEVYLIAGNHDGVAKLADADYVYDKHGLVCYHGHQLDPANRGRGTLGRIASGIWGFLERIRLGGVLAGLKRRVVRWNDRRMNTAAKRGGGASKNDRYIRDAVERQAVLTITGHTHAQELVRLGSDLERVEEATSRKGLPGSMYANCGCWTQEGVGHAVVVDGCSVKLMEVRK